MTSGRFPASLCSSQPAAIGFAVMLIGFILVATSFVIGVGSVTNLVKAAGDALIQKEVGFGSAINWSLMLCVLFPAAILYTSMLYCSSWDAFSRLAAHGMLLTEERTPVTRDQIFKLWGLQLERARYALLGLISVGLAFSLWEWYGSSNKPLFANDIRLAQEWDWSVGVLLNDSGLPTVSDAGSRAANAAFSMAAFLGQAALLATLLTMLYLAMTFSLFFRDFAGSGIFLVPDLKSPDQRRGFEVFDGMIEQFLVCVGLFYLIFYASRLQNVYLRSSSASLSDFIKDDLALGLTTNPLSLGTFSGIIRQGSSVPSSDFSSIMVCLATFAVLVVAIFFISTTVRTGAMKAKARAEDLMRDEPGVLPSVQALGSMAPAKVKAQLKSMVFWPIKYIKAYSFFALIVAGVSCIIFYRFAIILAGVLVGGILLRFLKNLRGNAAKSN